MYILYTLRDFYILLISYFHHLGSIIAVTRIQQKKKYHGKPKGKLDKNIILFARAGSISVTASKVQGVLLQA